MCFTKKEKFLLPTLLVVFKCISPTNLAVVSAEKYWLSAQCCFFMCSFFVLTNSLLCRMYKDSWKTSVALFDVCLTVHHCDK